MTTKLYQNDVYCQKWEATITSVEPTEDATVYRILLDRTAFFPEGGGQSCDLGYIGDMRVIDVQEDAEEVIHTVSFGDVETRNSDGVGVEVGDVEGKSAKAALPAPGDQVLCSIDWTRRFDNMQRHCGEHILSGIFYARCGGVNRGFHMGEDYMTIDISLEDEPADADAEKPDRIDMELALDCEMRANEVIWSDAPVHVFRFDNRDEVNDIPLRKSLAFDEDISIVCIGSPENASDCVACCGTHPSSAGQVGVIKIYKVENYKGMFRIYFDAGKRALLDYERKHSIISDLANSHSSSIDDLPAAIHSQEEKLSSAKDELYHLKKALIGRERVAIDELMAETEGNSPLVFTVEDLMMDDAFELSKAYMGKVPRLLLLYVKKQTSFILVSDGSVPCGKLVREYASFYNGKGGGNDTSARAIFSSEEDAMLFADLVDKHLR